MEWPNPMSPVRILLVTNVKLTNEPKPFPIREVRLNLAKKSLRKLSIHFAIPLEYKLLTYDFHWKPMDIEALTATFHWNTQHWLQFYIGNQWNTKPSIRTSIGIRSADFNFPMEIIGIRRLRLVLPLEYVAFVSDFHWNAKWWTKARQLAHRRELKLSSRPKRRCTQRQTYNGDICHFHCTLHLFVHLFKAKYRFKLKCNIRRVIRSATR